MKKKTVNIAEEMEHPYLNRRIPTAKETRNTHPVCTCSIIGTNNLYLLVIGFILGAIATL